MTQIKQYPEAIAAIVCGIFALLGWLALDQNFLAIALLLLPAAYIIGGYGSAKEGLTTLFVEKELDVDLLMIVAALGAAILGLWRQEYYLIVDGAILILIFAISGALESYTMGQTERSIRSLMSLTSDIARVIVDHQEYEIAINKLQIGDKVLVKPGELIPIDGIITEGYSSINQTSITGESMPVEKTRKDEVFAGTINGNGALTLKVHQPPESSLIQRIIDLVKQAQTEAPPSQQFMEKFERIYAKVIVIVGVLLASLPPLLLNWDWETTIYRALIFLVVASPCALMAAIMPTLLSGIAKGAKIGILFKSGAQLEKIGQVRAIAFDKTGTLTTGQPQVVQVIPLEGESENHLLQLAATLEVFSEHPIGQAIVKAAKIKNLSWSSAKNINSHPGLGITGDVEEIAVMVGRESFIKHQLETGVMSPLIKQGKGGSLSSQQLEAEGKTVVWIAANKKVIGLIALADTIRPEAALTIKGLKELGIEKIVMLTGDNYGSAKGVAQQLGIDKVYAEVLPFEKLSIIKSLQKQYQFVAMVGDGINDAPALAAATVGIAMGGAGSDVALETADIVLMADSLEKLEQAISLGRRAQKIVKQNVIFALSFIVLLLITNFTGDITMPLGVIGHEGSTVLVTLSGLRLLR